MVSVPDLKRRIDDRLTGVVSEYVGGDATAHVGLLNARERTRDGDSDDAIQYPYVGYEGFTRPNQRGLTGANEQTVTFKRDVDGNVTERTGAFAYTLRLDVGVFAPDRVTRDELTSRVRDTMVGYTRTPATLNADVTDVKQVNVASDDAITRNVVGLRDTYEIDFQRTHSESVTAVEAVEVTLSEISTDAVYDTAEFE